MTVSTEPEGASASAADGSGDTPMDRFRAAAIAEVEGELAALRASSESRVRRRRAPGPSVVFTLRLGHDELAALERRAALLGLPPSVLARNLIRVGLADTARPSLGRTIDRLEAALADLRSLDG